MLPAFGIARVSQDVTRSVLIVGGGSAGWMAAAALARFAPRGWQVRLVESEAIGTVGVGEATIPQIRLFNAGLGIDEAEFLRATHGTMKLGIEFRGWGAPDQRYIHGFGAVGRGLGLIGFHHYWLRAQALGEAEPFGAYSLNNEAALLGRFSNEARSPSSAIPDMPYAYHFDAGAYALFLRRYAEARGVERIEGRIEQVEHDARGGIAAVQLEGERRLAADLFVDCSGFRSLLLGEALGVGYEDWSEWLPCDRAVAVPSERTGALTPYTRATAQRAGWQWRIPLQHRTGNGHVYASAHLSDDEAAETLLANLDGAPAGEPRLLRFTAGKRRDFWRGNCVALGLASGFLEPLESTSIHLVQSGIARLLQFLPAGDMHEADRDEYNRLTHIEYDRIRDFLVLHYHANGRTGEALWDHCRNMALPEELQRKLALFRSSARLSRRDEELFAEPGWLQVMLGQGVMPEAWHPLAEQLSPQDLAGFLATVRTVVARTANAMPSHEAALTRLCATPEMELSA